MAGIAAGGNRPETPAEVRRRRRSAGIYGAIITAAILDTAGDRMSTGALVIAVVVTLVVYWLAEEYAELLGEQVEGGRLPTWTYIQGALVIARLAGATSLEAANAGLVMAVMVLAVHGWTASRASHLRGHQLLLTTSIAIGLGLAMIALKDLVLIHLH